jgi:hypothetical protein
MIDANRLHRHREIKRRLSGRGGTTPRRAHFRAAVRWKPVINQ